MAFRGAGGPGLQSKVKKTNFEADNQALLTTQISGLKKKNSFAIIVLSRAECKNYQFVIIFEKSGYVFGTIVGFKYYRNDLSWQCNESSIKDDVLLSVYINNYGIKLRMQKNVDKIMYSNSGRFFGKSKEKFSWELA